LSEEVCKFQVPGIPQLCHYPYVGILN
jgi:hypothetical protein